MAIYIVIYFETELPEPLAVIVPASGQMHVTEDKHCMFGLVTGFEETEIHPLGRGGILLEKHVVGRQDTFGGHLVTAWDRDEHIAILLGRLHLVYSVGIGRNHFHAVRDDNALERLVAAIYPSVNCAALSRLYAIGDNDAGIAKFLDGLAPANRHGVIVSYGAIVEGDGYIFGGDIDYPAVVALAAGVAENYDVGALRCLAEHDPEFQEGVSADIDFSRNVKLDVKRTAGSAVIRTRNAA